MPVDHGDVDAITAAVVDIYADAEQALIALLTRQLAAGGFDDDTSTWAARKLTEVRALGRAAQLLVDQLETDGGAAIRQALADGWRSGSATALTDLVQQNIGDPGPAARTADQAAGKAVQALAEATVGELRPVYTAVLRSTDDVFRQAVAGATARRLAGARDTRRAAQDAYAALIRQGVTGFRDSAGRNWRLSTYVEMSVRTAVARAAVAGEVDAMLAAGVTMCYVVDNPRECPICRPFEGKVLALRAPRETPAIATLGEAMKAGLFHPNCRHTVRPWSPGVRIVAARKPEGPEGYEAEQAQRALERKLRAWRERFAGAFDDQGRQFAATRIAAWSQRLADHLDAHPKLPRRSYREHPGAGFRAPKNARTRRDAARLARR